jgi:hypothetical protein
LPTTQGAFQTTSSGGAFVTKLNPTGSALVYSTYLAGTWDADYGKSIAVDAAGDAYVTGQAVSPDFPTTPNSFDPVFNATIELGNEINFTDNGMAFATELDATGSGLVYSTFLGGSTNSAGYGIVVDASGNAYVAGTTQDGDFPTLNAYQAKDPSTGDAGFVTKFNATGSALLFSTFLGGSGNSGANAIAVDSSGEAYVGGGANSSDFPTTPGAFQTNVSNGAFVTKFNAAGNGLVYSTRLANGGPGVSGIALDGSGDAYVTGNTELALLPLKNALQGYNANGMPEAYISELNPSGSALVFSTYLGGTGAPSGSGNNSNYGGSEGNSIAVDSSGNIYVAGMAWANFPTTPGTFQTAYGGAPDAFVAKINPDSPSFAVTGYPSPTTAGVAHTFTVTALNADGSVNTNYTGTVHFSSTDPQAGLPSDYPFTPADQGVHTFTVTLKTAGNQSIVATDTATGSISGIETGITVQPAAAAKFVLSAPSSVKSGAKFSVTLTVYDAYGNVATGYTGTVHFSSSDGSATLPGNYTFVSADAGVHTFSNKVILKKRGTQTLAVTDTLNGALTVTDTIDVT